MSIKKDEWLSFEDTNKGLEVLKEKPLDYYSDVFSPWQTKQKLKIWREVEWSVWQFKLGSFTITATGNISITWVWFKPKLVKFSVGNHLWSVSWWIWSITETEQQCLNITNSTTITTQCIYYWNPVNARAVYVSMDSDWFTINCTYFANNTYVLYECYW